MIHNSCEYPEPCDCADCEERRYKNLEDDKARIFGTDRITINDLFTFKKSSIDGIYASHCNSVYSSNHTMKMFIIVNGTSIQVDETPYKGDQFREEQLKEYHREWEIKLNEIGNLKEKKLI